MGRIEIKVKGQTLVCETYTLEHAMFFGTLLMSPDELHVYINEEDPDRAFQQMSKRLGDFIEGLKVKLAGTEDQEKIINDEVVNMFSSRMLVRINQNRVANDLIPDIRYEVAKRLQEVFPLINRTWVNNTAINLEPSDLVSAVALPLFIYMAQVNKVEPETASVVPPQTEAPATSTAGQGFGKTKEESPAEKFLKEKVSQNPLFEDDALVDEILAEERAIAQTPSVEPEKTPGQKILEDKDLMAEILAEEKALYATPTGDSPMPDEVRKWLEKHPNALIIGKQ